MRIKLSHNRGQEQRTTSYRPLPSWWTEFRRELDRKGVKRLSDRRWAAALQIKRDRSMSQWRAAEHIAMMPPR